MVEITDRLFSLVGRTALVTGGTSGIGRMIASAFVEAGAATYIVGRKSDTAMQVADELGATALIADVSSAEGITTVAAQFASEAGPGLHVLVNNAGATWGAPIDDYPDKAWDKVLGLNLKSVFQLTAALLPALRRSASPQDPARVINIGSIHGLITPEFESYAYSASKAGVHHLTRHLAHRLGREHILVNAIAPGPFPSKMMAATIAAQEHALLDQTATGRLGVADDMAGVALYLAGQGAANVTGAVIPVDGGYGTTR